MGGILSNSVYAGGHGLLLYDMTFEWKHRQKCLLREKAETTSGLAPEPASASAPAVPRIRPQNGDVFVLLYPQHAYSEEDGFTVKWIEP